MLVIGDVLNIFLTFHVGHTINLFAVEQPFIIDSIGSFKKPVSLLDKLV